jgi:hypothetical protein
MYSFSFELSNTLCKFHLRFPSRSILSVTIITRAKIIVLISYALILYVHCSIKAIYNIAVRKYLRRIKAVCRCNAHQPRKAQP